MKPFLLLYNKNEELVSIYRNGREYRFSTWLSFWYICNLFEKLYSRTWNYRRLYIFGKPGYLTLAELETMAMEILKPLPWISE